MVVKIKYDRGLNYNICVKKNIVTIVITEIKIKWIPNIQLFKKCLTLEVHTSYKWK